MFILPSLFYYGRSGASALPCAGAAPPQRPALASHLVHSSPATCLANSVSYPTCSLSPLTTDH